MSFWGFSCFHLYLTTGALGLYAHTSRSWFSWVLRIQTQAPIFAQQAFTHWTILLVPAVTFKFPFVCVYFAACAFSVKYKKSLPIPTLWWFCVSFKEFHILGLMLTSLILSKLTFVYDVGYRFNFILLNAFSFPSPIYMILTSLSKKHLTICDHLLSK